jgi:hypothetical protein
MPETQRSMSVRQRMSQFLDLLRLGELSELNVERWTLNVERLFPILM